MDSPTLDPAAVRLAWRATEPLHAMIYFVPEATERYAALGLHSGAGYFSSRSAPLGAVGPGPVTAMFFNFNPGLVAHFLPAAWEKVTPEQVLAARLAAAGAALTRGLGEEVIAGPEMAEAAGLARRAAESASARPEGRPLYAAHAQLPWPDEPHLVLWHAQTLLREFRGDGHVARLLLTGLTPTEVLVLYVADGQAEPGFLRKSRGWNKDEWAAAADRLRDRGLLDGDGALTDAGRELRAAIEADTDRLGTAPYEVLGADGCARLAELTRPMSRTIVKAGFLSPA